MDNGVNGSTEGYLFCNKAAVIQIQNATYGQIGGGSKRNITNEAIPCQSRNGSKIYLSTHNKKK